jgi:hypothetical protein
VPTVHELAAELAALRARVEVAEATLAIQALKARYAELVDARYHRGHVVAPERLATLAHEIAALFTDDAEWDGGPALGTARGRDAIAARMREPTLSFSRHLFLTPRIRVDGDHATARWDLLAPCTTADGVAQWVCGVEDDDYRRGEDSRWRHGRMVLTTVFVAPADRGWQRILA